MLATPSARATGPDPAPPILRSQPLDQSLMAGAALLFDHFATGSGPITYRWYRDGNPLEGLEPYSNGLGVWITRDANPDHSGRYWYVATGTGGSSTSRVAMVTIRPAGPNPDFAGGRLTRILEAGARPEGANDAFAHPLARAPMRWLGNRLLLSGASSNGVPLGLIEATRTGNRIRVPFGKALPGGLGNLIDVQLPEGARADDPVLVHARTAGSGYPIGVYRLEADDTLVPVLDRNTVAPGTAGERFLHLPTFFGQSPVVQRGERAVMVADTATRSGVYLLDGTGLRRLFDNTTGLPGLPAGSWHVRQVAFDGSRAAYAIEPEPGSSRFLGLWIQDIDSGLPASRVEIAKLPGETTGLGGLDRLVLEAGTLYFVAGTLTGTFGTVFSWRDGVTRRLMGPGDIVEAAGYLAGVEFFSLDVDRGRVFSFAFMAQDNGRIPIVAEPDGRLLWLLPGPVDGRPVRHQGVGARVQGAREGRVVLLVPFATGAPSALYANLDPLLRARPSPAPGGGIRIELPDRLRLETAPTPGGPWIDAGVSPVNADTGPGFVDLPVTAGTGFYRAIEVP